MAKDIPKHKCDKDGRIIVQNIFHKAGGIKGLRIVEHCSVCGLPTRSRESGKK